jgi:transcriptional regulator with XRE-family HTH domain
MGLVMDCNHTRTATAVPTSMTPDERAFFQAMGRRISETRKALGITQVQLADALGVAQQVVASYEVGRHRVPASFLPRLARTLAVSVEELIGEEPQRSRRGPSPRLLQQIERIQRLPKAKQRFVMQMIDTALQANLSDAAE